MYSNCVKVNLKILKEDKVLTAKAHYAKKKGKALPENPYDWRDSTIVGILERMDYCGHTVNFKSYSKSHKLKKRIPTTKEQQAPQREDLRFPGGCVPAVGQAVPLSLAGQGMGTGQ